MSPYLPIEAPRGLPVSLPAPVPGTAQLSTVTITSAGGRLAMTYQGQNFPPFPTETTVYALLVVDDSSQRAEGVLLYAGQRPPNTYPDLASVTASSRKIPLYGIRADWASVSN